jgi:SpoVK/Ycf46/Vps4 family AAA+-type ATPase
MTYTSYLQVIKDVNYMDEFNPADGGRRFGLYYDYEREISPRQIKKLKNIWLEHLKEKYNDTIKTTGALGKFLAKYPLKFNEFRCLLDLIESHNEKTDFEIEAQIALSTDLFRKHRIRYGSSQLKRFKLVYKIVNPLRPMRAIYEVSYKAQLALKNKKYTDAYEQLDLAFEEESKRNSPDELESLYYVIEPKISFNDLVASKNLMESLRAALSREKQKNKIFKNWGFNKVIEYGKGTTLNFRGPPGTGKTMAANCMANALGRKLLMVRYDQLQSCWVGGTEKHIQQVFKLAKVKNAVLFFDEADAIALSRASLEKSWEMSQVNTLLKELERFEGVCIFATNFAGKYDEAFERRLTMHIDFELPDKKQQLRILDKLLPKKSRDKKMYLEGFNLDGLSGGDIKNVALNAAGFAAKDNSDKIKMKHVCEAIVTVMKGKTNAEDNCEHEYLG